MPPKSPDPDLLAINTIPTLAMDAVQAANSGHPGTPMAPAPVVYHDTYSGHHGVDHDAVNMLVTGDNEPHERWLGKVGVLEDEVRRHAT